MFWAVFTGCSSWSKTLFATSKRGIGRNSGAPAPSPAASCGSVHDAMAMASDNENGQSGRLGVKRNLKVANKRSSPKLYRNERTKERMFYESMVLQGMNEWLKGGRRSWIYNIHPLEMWAKPAYAQMSSYMLPIPRRFRLPSPNLLHVQCKFCVIRAVGRNLQFLHVWARLRENIASNAMTRTQTIICFSVREPGAALSPLAIRFECVHISVFC